MVSQKANIVAAVDVGSSKVACVIAEKSGSEYRVVGAATRRAHGLRYGVVTDMAAAENTIRATVDAAEKMAGERVDRVFTVIAGGAPSSHTVGVEIEAPDREIGNADVYRLLRQAGARTEPGDRTVLHAIPVSFSLDGAQGIVDPRGMAGRRLGVDVHVVTVADGARRNLAMCIERCMLKPEAMVTGPYAAGLGCLDADELALGAAVVDLGAEVTKIGIFSHNSLIHTDTFTIGGSHVTRDIATLLSTTYDEAERLKTTRGSALNGPRDDETAINVQSLGTHWTQGAPTMPLSVVNGVIRPRIEEILETVRECIDSSGYPSLARKVVLTGGGSQLTAIDRIAAEILEKPVRLGRPQNDMLGALPLSMTEPEFSALTGAMRFAERRLENMIEEAKPTRPTGRIARLGRWLKENF